MSVSRNTPLGVAPAGQASQFVDTPGTVIQGTPGAQDATHSSFTVVQDPNAKPEKMPFKEQVKGYAKMYAGKAFGNMDEVALGKAKLADQLPDKS